MTKKYKSRIRKAIRKIVEPQQRKRDEEILRLSEEALFCELAEDFEGAERAHEEIKTRWGLQPNN